MNTFDDTPSPKLRLAFSWGVAATCIGVLLGVAIALLIDYYVNVQGPCA